MKNLQIEIKNEVFTRKRTKIDMQQIPLAQKL